MTIPSIDFSTYRDDDAAAIGALAVQVERALSGAGFMTLNGTGLPTADIFATSAAFFARAKSEKRRYLYRDAAENFGYQGLGMESLDPGKPGDLKETFTLRLDPSRPLPAERWPSYGFRVTAEQFYGQCLEVARRLMRVMARVFDLPADFFTDTVGGENVALRLLHYPGSQRDDGAEDQLGAGAHTDYGILTLLFQGGVPGLEVRGSDGRWQPVPCVPGAVVVNTGDLMQRWTNGRFRSTEHRVRPMTGERARYSVAFFVDPDSDTVIETLPACLDSDNPQGYRPITAGEHIRQKLQGSHNQ